ncbi:MAG: DUF1257 domain-containing protein [Synechococcaceae cyanobacterium SM2_3_1]|nr:DUF1257 domain-containing protein [Synechococcaceae cyanobacterium SM2_3_1]
MSHFTTIQVEIRDGELLLEVLEELGYTVEQNASVRGYLWNRTKADYVIRQQNGFDLGFRRQGDRYELVSDFWGAKIDQQAFLDQVMQKYAHKNLKTSAQKQGFAIEAEEQLEDGTIRVVVGRWV